MKAVARTSQGAVVLGIAFLLQAITSLTSGMILKTFLIVPGNLSESMIRIANNPLLLRVNIFGDVLTAAGLIFLGAILFVTLRKQNEEMALVAFGFYILEAALLAGSRIAAFALLRISQGYATTGHPEILQTIGSLASESMSLGFTLAMLSFGLGGPLFYYLLYKSGIVPRALSLWGLVTGFITLVATVLVIFGIEVPFAVYLPYAPFEFTIGVWFLVKGIRKERPYPQAAAC